MLYFTFWRTYYKYDLQDDDEPSKLSNDFAPLWIGFNPDISQGADYFWQVTKIIEEKGMFDKLIGNKKESFGGNYYKSAGSTMNTTILYGSDFQDFHDERLKYGYYKVLYFFNSVNQFDDYIE